MVWPFKRKPKPVWRYVGTYDARSYITDDNGDRVPGQVRYGYWTLRESDQGEREAVLAGNYGHSPHALSRAAQIAAWRAGGPLPDFEPLTWDPAPEPKPKEKPESDGKVITFPKSS